MTVPSIKTATRKEMEECIAVIVLGFANDPGVRWMYPNSRQYLENFSQFVRAFGGSAFEHGTAHYVEGFLASALWLPPGAQPDEEALGGFIENSVQKSEHEAVFALFEQLEEYHPEEPHWYLPLIATDPTQQSNGYGSVLLRHALAVSDQQQEPAYLEATSVRSVPLYQRHGFEVLGTIQVGSSPPIVPMLRAPQ